MYTVTNWPNRDPIQEQGGLNLYAMVQNNPLGYWDYLGMRWFGDNDDGIQVGRKNTIVSDQPGKLGEKIEKYVPAMETMGYIHDSWVGDLTEAGVPDLIANIPTMPPAYVAAVALETTDSLKSLVDYILDFLAPNQNDRGPSPPKPPSPPSPPTPPKPPKPPTGPTPPTPPTGPTGPTPPTPPKNSSCK
jgi:hypothetical protein